MKSSEQRSFPMPQPFKPHHWLTHFRGMSIAWGLTTVLLLVLALDVWSTLARLLWLGTGLSGAIAIFCALGLMRAFKRQTNGLLNTTHQLHRQIDPEAIDPLPSTLDPLTHLQTQLASLQAIQAETHLHREVQFAARSQALTDNLRTLQSDHLQRFQKEKMAGLNQMVAGLAHELNNPINFIEGNIPLAQSYIQDLLLLVVLYQQALPHPGERIQDHLNTIELDFLQSDLPKMLASMRIGTQRVQHIVRALRTFARLDESALKKVDVHTGLDSTVFFLLHRLRLSDQRPFRIVLIKQYGSVPAVECYASQLNQVFLSLLTNAIDAIETYHPHAPSDYQPQITVRTAMRNAQNLLITIADNGMGIPDSVRDRLFDPFFTTKPVGEGTGLGLAISHQIIVEQHQGTLTCDSVPHQGATFHIEIPLTQTLSTQS